MAVENKNIKKFYQQSPKPFNYVPSDLVEGLPQQPPAMSGLMRIDPVAGNIWVSAGNSLVTDWKLLTGGGGGGGLTSVGLTMPPAFTVVNSPLTVNGSITVSGAGDGSQYIDGSGNLQTFPSLGQGLQSVISYDNDLTANNVIAGNATSIRWSGNSVFDILPLDTGYFRVQLGKFPPNFTRIYAEDTYAEIYSESSSAQFVKVDSTGVYIQTPLVDSGTATNGQVLTLTDSTTGQVEYTSQPIRTIVLGADTDMAYGTGFQTITPPSGIFYVNVFAGKSYTFRAVIYYDLYTGTAGNFGMAGSPVTTSATFTNSAYYYQVWDGTGTIRTFPNLVDGSFSIPLSSPTTSYTDTNNIIIIEGVLSEADVDGILEIALSTVDAGVPSYPNSPYIVRKGSSITIYETS